MLAFGTLALQCAPAIAVDLLAALVAVESGFDPLAINATGVRQTYAHAGMAVAGAVEAGQRSDNFGVGLAGVRFGDLGTLGLSVGDAFDACKNLAAFEAVVQSRFEVANRRGFGPSAADKFVIRASWQPDGRFGSSEAFEQAVQAERSRVAVHIKTIVRGTEAPGAGRSRPVAGSSVKPESAAPVKHAVAAGPVTPVVREQVGARLEVFTQPSASRSLLIFSKQPEAGSPSK
jgi:type IV secretion system protein VirB1